MEQFIPIIILFGLAYITFRGGYLTFKRNEWLALFCLLFLFPVWFVWALIETFEKPVVKEEKKEEPAKEEKVFNINVIMPKDDKNDKV